jgi:hypothetical protein
MLIYNLSLDTTNTLCFTYWTKKNSVIKKVNVLLTSMTHNGYAGALTTLPDGYELSAALIFNN